MSNKEKLQHAKKLLIEVVDNWNEDEVKEYGIDKSFDEFVAELLTVSFK